MDWLGKAGLLSSLEKHQSGNVENNKEGQRKFTYALEFVDGWIAGRIALVGVLPILLAIIAAVAWHMGGPQREGGGAGAFELGILVIVGGYGLVGILAVLSL